MIIFARIREELASGKTVRNAIKIGFDKALSAIIDDNESGRNHRQGDTKENAFPGDDGQRPGLFPHAVELLALPL